MREALTNPVAVCIMSHLLFVLYIIELLNFFVSLQLALGKDIAFHMNHNLYLND